MQPERLWGDQLAVPPLPSLSRSSQNFLGLSGDSDGSGVGEADAVFVGDTALVALLLLLPQLASNADPARINAA